LFLMYPREKRGFAMGLAGLVINVAPAVGPPISGALVNYFDCRALFLLTLPIAACILLLVFLYMRNVTEQQKTNIDPLSILLSSVGFGGMLYAFNQVEENGISDPVTLAGLVEGAVALVLFAVRQLRLSTPILELRVFTVPVFRSE